MGNVTLLLERSQSGEANAAGELLPLVYGELRKLAAVRMAQQPPGQTLQATALVHEAWLRLAGGKESPWRNRQHFFRAAAEAMRHILIDRARRRQALRHGGGLQRVEVEEPEIAAPAGDEELLAVNDALERLAVVDPAKAALVELRYFVGLTLEEAATALGISEPTAKRRWSLARAWLFNEIRSRRE
jgi:RNA polymerase sigma factor (TIGR02999 family)